MTGTSTTSGETASSGTAAESDDCNPGDLGCECASAQLCLGGLACVEGVCEVPGQTGSTDQGVTSAGSSSTSGGVATTDDTRSTSAATLTSSTSTDAESTATEDGVLRLYSTMPTSADLSGSNPELAANALCEGSIPADCGTFLPLLNLDGVSSMDIVVGPAPGGRPLWGPLGVTEIASDLEAALPPNLIETPLNSTLADSGLGSGFYWTGFMPDGSAGSDCEGWTSTETTAQGNAGASDAVDSEWYANHEPHCGNDFPILCLCW